MAWSKDWSNNSKPRNNKGNYSNAKMDKNNMPNHSGAKKHKSRIDKSTGEVVPCQIITAWNYSKSRGMISLIASPRKKGTDTKNPYQKMFTCKVFFKKSLETKYYLGFYNEKTHLLTIPDMQMVVNTKIRKKNGEMGYFGKYTN